MKKPFQHLKNRLFLVTSVLLITFLSCKKTATNCFPPLVDVTKLTDSCSYTLDGVPFVCNEVYSTGGGNAGANLDTANGGWKWNADTLLYIVYYSIHSHGLSAGIGGNLTLRLVKKFSKNQLTRTITPSIFGPVSDTLLYYPKGERSYAVDYSRFNSENGVALEITTGSVGNVPITMTTYSTQMVHWPTTITNDSQKASKFEITNVYFFPANGSWLDSHIFEAKFNVVLFDGDEKPHQLENGYIRIHVN